MPSFCRICNNKFMDWNEFCKHVESHTLGELMAIKERDKITYWNEFLVKFFEALEYRRRFVAGYSKNKGTQPLSTAQPRKECKHINSVYPRTKNGFIAGKDVPVEYWECSDCGMIGADLESFA